MGGTGNLHRAGVGDLIWLVFVVTTISIDNAFQRRPLGLTVIDRGRVARRSAGASSGTWRIRMTTQIFPGFPQRRAGGLL
jgi:hypothetical protein